MTDTLRLPRAFTSAAALLSIVFAASCQHATMVHVPLQYRPTNTLGTATVGAAGGQSLAVIVTDSRTDGTVVGKNIEKANAEIPVYADGSPEQFVREAVSRELGNAGLTIASDPAQAKRVLRLDLRRFWTEEEATYHGTVTAGAEVKTASGKVLWQGVASGSSKRFGRSLSPENYQETFSDATLDMVESLLKNADFVAALKAPEPSAAPQRGRTGKSRH